LDSITSTRRPVSGIAPNCKKEKAAKCTEMIIIMRVQASETKRGKRKAVNMSISREKKFSPCVAELFPSVGAFQDLRTDSRDLDGHVGAHARVDRLFHGFDGARE
jgi:hypothetical protein